MCLAGGFGKLLHKQRRHFAAERMLAADLPNINRRNGQRIADQCGIGRAFCYKLSYPRIEPLDMREARELGELLTAKFCAAGRHQRFLVPAEQLSGAAEEICFLHEGEKLGIVWGE